MGWEHKRLSYVVSVFTGVFLCCMVGRVCGDLKDLQVPCYFIFGDSLVDNGNNNNLATLARANFPPYGVDFPSGATGRFTNGRTTADVLGQLLGFSTFVQPFANISRDFMLQGVNYASAAGGILNETGQRQGPRTSLDGQLNDHETTVAEIFKIFGSNVEAAKYLRHCLYTVGIGSNDYLNNYFMPQYYPTNQQYTPEKYAQILIDQYSLQLERLFDIGARKVALWGLGPIGCAPYEVVASVTNGSPCADNINAAVQLFNERLKLLVDDLNLNFKSAKFTYINIYDISLDTLINPLSYGFKTANETCCGVGKNNAQIRCFPLETPCSNRTEYVFWDAFHPTEAANIIIAGRAYSARTPIDTYPWDIKTLAKQEIN